MTENEVYEALKGVFEDVFDEEVHLTPQTSAPDVEGWDSLAHIRLMMTVERKFGIKFSTLEINDLETVGDLVSLILRHGA